MLLGCIGDDFTGSSDLANTLAKQGMNVVQYSGIPTGPAEAGVDAGVVALKSRSLPVQDAVQQSLQALDWLVQQGCEQIFFKYCSTFDSTPEGNIGPVAEALAKALEAKNIIVCPAFPGTGRSVYQGHLFVGDVPLHESGMQNHPLTPMTDPDLRRWLAPQTTMGVGHVPAQTVFQGAVAILAGLETESAAGRPMIIVDAIRDADLMEIGRAANGLPLVTGGSGMALGLPANFGFAPKPVPWQGQTGRGCVLSGSCSTMTRAQVAYHAARHPAFEIHADDVIGGLLKPEHAVAFLAEQSGLPLVHSSADPDVVARVQARHGAQTASAALEHFFADVARLAIEAGFTRIITAGGETSGAVVEGLWLDTLKIGPEIATGVPALRAAENLVMALKSGNFGQEDFFERADALLSGQGIGQ